MKGLLHKIGSVLILFVVLFSTTGLTYYAHTCNCTQETSYSILPGLLSEKPQSCCGEDINSPAQEQNAISKTKCCKNQFFFYQLPFVNHISATIYLNSNETLYCNALAILAPVTTNSQQPEQPVLYNGPPPLEFGKKLIILLNQVKIPYSVL